MAYQPRILAFNGSLRAASWNDKLVRIAARGAEGAGARVTRLHLKDLPMPVFSQDLEEEQGMDPNGARFKELLAGHDGWLIASPEYNSSISGALKNAIDWASRREGDEPPLAAFADKTAVIMAASPGSLGGLRGLVHLRAILGNLGVTVLPAQHALAGADRQFDADGELADTELRQKIEGLGARLSQVCRKLYG